MAIRAPDGANNITYGKCSVTIPMAWQPQEVFCLVIGPAGMKEMLVTASRTCCIHDNMRIWKNSSCRAFVACQATETSETVEICQVMILPLSEIHFVAFLLLTSALARHRSQHAFPSFLLSNVFNITGNWKVLKPRKDIQWGRSPPTLVQNTRARSRSGVYAAEPWVLWRVGEGDCLQVNGNSN